VRSKRPSGPRTRDISSFWLHFFWHRQLGLEHGVSQM
jgi:hypothetical protein